MTTFKINLNQIRWDSNHSRMLDALERGFKHFNIDFYLIGAVARDIWLQAIHEFEPSRATMDIDLAVLI